MIEGIFASFKEMGFAGKSQARPRWAGDDQMDHLAWMTAVTLSARRLVRANGLYEQVFQEAKQLGLLQASSPTAALAPLFTPEEWADWEQALKQYAKAPEHWPDLNSETDEFHEIDTAD